MPVAASCAVTFPSSFPSQSDSSSVSFGVSWAAGADTRFKGDDPTTLGKRESWVFLFFLAGTAAVSSRTLIVFSWIDTDWKLTSDL